MIYTRNIAIIFWCLLCGFLLSFGSYKFAFSSPYFFIIALFFYIIGVPFIYFVEGSNNVSSVKYNILKYISFLTFFLMAMMDLVRVFHGIFNLMAPFFIFYVSIGFWALLSVWFFVVSRKYGNISLAGKIYAVISLIVINGSGLIFSLMFSLP